MAPESMVDALYDLCDLLTAENAVSLYQFDIADHIHSDRKQRVPYTDRKLLAHFDKVDEQYSGNLALKLALIEEVKAYKVGDTREDDINAMREFQNRWNAIGYVPFKEKEKVQKEFNTALDMHFADIRSLEGEKKLNKFRRMVAEVKNSGKGDRGLRFEREKLLLKYRKMEQDIATLENNMGFFARTKNADSMIADVKKKISIAKEELARIEEKIRIIDNQFE